MSRFWPLVMWFEQKKNNVLVYKPSRYHANRATASHAFDSYWKAHVFAQQQIKLTLPDTDLPANALPSFLPWVIEQDNEPDMSPSSTLRLLVRRISLAEDT